LQADRDVDPPEAVVKPAGQSVQEVWRGRDWNVPLAQSEHGASPFEEKDPAVHGAIQINGALLNWLPRHDDASTEPELGVVVPEGQAVQWREAALGAKVPVGQAEQGERPSSENSPALQRPDGSGNKLRWNNFCIALD
jgi:hypothetical protein